MKHWLSVSEAASLLGTSPRTVRRQCAAGTITARRVGGLWQVEMSAAMKSDKSAIDRAAKSDTDLNVKSDKSDIPVSDNRPNRTSETDKSDSDLTKHLLEEVKFLRAALEQRDRDAAELRAALRSALKLTAGAALPELTAGNSSTIEPAPANRQQRDENNVAANDSHDAANGAGTGAETREKPLTYADICDNLERAMRK